MPAVDCEVCACPAVVEVNRRCGGDPILPATVRTLVYRRGFPVRALNACDGHARATRDTLSPGEIIDYAPPDMAEGPA